MSKYRAALQKACLTQDCTQVFEYQDTEDFRCVAERLSGLVSAQSVPVVLHAYSMGGLLCAAAIQTSRANVAGVVFIDCPFRGVGKFLQHVVELVGPFLGEFLQCLGLEGVEPLAAGPSALLGSKFGPFLAPLFDEALLDGLVAAAGALPHCAIHIHGTDPKQKYFAQPWAAEAAHREFEGEGGHGLVGLHHMTIFEGQNLERVVSHVQDFLRGLVAPSAKAKQAVAPGLRQTQRQTRRRRSGRETLRTRQKAV
eukprot:TRINITY_DN4170_c0_g1_i1.p1 TRINITY_DN4170_c0_g1~~TRINITY_DN4170_c0_g1_i1.p1  ORF type:complete len:290 (+),score=48.22 TRINITY_DN4170_c0_g1_i1:111-872(+)